MSAATKLKALQEALEAFASSADDEIESAVNEMYEAQAARDHAERNFSELIEAVLYAVELTYVHGPAAGMDHIVETYHSLEHDLTVGFPCVPYDWLSRWLPEGVTLMPWQRWVLNASFRTHSHMMQVPR